MKLYFGSEAVMRFFIPFPRSIMFNILSLLLIHDYLVSNQNIVVCFSAGIICDGKHKHDYTTLKNYWGKLRYEKHV